MFGKTPLLCFLARVVLMHQIIDALNEIASIGPLCLAWLAVKCQLQDGYVKVMSGASKFFIACGSEPKCLAGPMLAVHWYCKWLIIH